LGTGDVTLKSGSKLLFKRAVGTTITNKITSDGNANNLVRADITGSTSNSLTFQNSIDVSNGNLILSTQGGNISVNNSSVSPAAGSVINAANITIDNRGSTITDAGVITTDGASAPTNSRGVQFNNATLNANGNLNVYGSSATASSPLWDGIWFSNSIINNTTGTTHVLGKSSSGGNGIYVENTSGISAPMFNAGSAGSMEIAGMSASGYGAQFYTGNIKTAGNVTLKGTSTSSTGLYSRTNISAGNNSTLTINGTSTTGAGVNLDWLNTSTGYNVSGGTSTAININGASTSGVGVNITQAVSTAGDINITAIGTNAASFTSASNGSVTSSAGNVKISADTMSIGQTVSATAGTVTLSTQTSGRAITVGGADDATAGTGGKLGLTNAELNQITATKTIIGSNTAGNISVDAAITTNSATGDITLLTAGNVSIGNTLSTGTKKLTLDALGSSSTITQAAAVTTAGLELLGGNASYTLNNTGNAVTTLAGNAKSIDFVNGSALTIGTVNSTNGINATGDISIATQTGDLTIAQNVATSATTASAVVMNAGKSTAAGTSSGGDIKLSGTQSITVGSDGRATLYTGSVSGSTGVTSLVGAGTGHFRYNSDETTTNYTTALGSGMFAIYREKPVITVNTIDKAITYGESIPALTATTLGLVNGDVLAYQVDSPLNSTSGNTRAGSYTISSNAAGYGYGLSSASSLGLLTVTPKAITLTGAVASDKVYDQNDTATLSNAGMLTGGATVSTDNKFYTGDIVSAINTGAKFSNGKNVVRDANGNSIAQSVTIQGLALDGADKGNYSVSDASNASAKITPKALTAELIQTVEKIYDGTTLATNLTNTHFSIVGWVSGEGATVTKKTASYASPDVAANLGNGLVSAVLSPTDYSANSGTDLANYNLPTLAKGYVGKITSVANPSDIINPVSPITPLSPSGQGGGRVMIVSAAATQPVGSFNTAGVECSIESLEACECEETLIPGTLVCFISDEKHF
ncbi:MAG: beta strand repeat-containing protein, partial [Methylomonas sp.]